MINVIEIFRNLFRDRRGVTAVEYAVIAGVICASLAAVFTALTGNLNSFFNSLTF